MFIIIGGPTATGKTFAAIELAKKINGEIISADSMQVYKGMDIGTNKVSQKERKTVPHHMLDIIAPSEAFSAADFKKRAEKLMNEIKKRGAVPIICGGTGLYISAVIKGLFEAGKIPEKIKEELRCLEKEKGLAYLVKELKEKDPAGAKQLDLKNPRRVIRSLEIIRGAGMTLAQVREKTERTKYPDSYSFFVTQCYRETLYKKINDRVESMIKAGLEKEVKKLLALGLNLQNTAMQAIGYKEMVLYIEGKANLQDTTDQIKQATRNYAKKQETWFRKYTETMSVDMDNLPPDKTGEFLKNMIVG